MGINRKYKYWELFFDEADGRQCMATHWSDEWGLISEMVNYEDDTLEGLVRGNIDYAKIRGDKVTFRSVKPAMAEFKKILTDNNFR
jgi:hypothetical protein